MEKRRREQLRKQKRMDKEHRRVQRAAERQAKRESGAGMDADLEEMIIGPQPGQIIEPFDDLPSKP